MKDIAEIISGLNPATQKRVKLASEVVLERLEMPSIGMNKALDGGIVYGRMALLWGNKSSGKSSLALQMVAKAQESGKACAWIDSEASFDPVWASRLGVDIEKLIHVNIKTVSDLAEIGTNLISLGVELLVIDSISALAPSSWFEKDDEMKDFNDTHQIGAFSKDLTKAINMLNVINENAAIVFISQIRNKFSTWGAMQRPMGGEGIIFYCSTIIKLWSSASDRDQKKGELYVGDKIFERNMGREVTWTVEYNKTGAPSISGTYDFYYLGDHVGIDLHGEIVDLAIQYGIIENKPRSAWYLINDEKYQGRGAVISAVRDDELLFKEIQEKLYEQIS